MDDLVPGQKALNDLQRLIQQLAANARHGLVAEGAELPPAVVAEADADDQPAAGELIEHRDLAGQHPGPTPGQGVTSAPILMWLVAIAIAASVVHASATAMPGSAST